MKKNVAIISAFFLPARHIAVSRVEAYAKYLALDHNVTVITLGKEKGIKELTFENGASCTVYYFTNKGLLTSLLFYTGKESWFLHKVKTLVRLVHDKLGISYFKPWAKLAKQKLRDELRENRVDFLISSYAPEDVLEVSFQCFTELRSIKTKWVLDMRDEYSDELRLSARVKKKRQKNEEKYSKISDLVVSVSEPLVDLFRKRMPYAKDFMEIRNGFDHEIQPPRYRKGDVLKIGYFGSLHGAAKPNVLFEAINELGLNDKIKIFFAIRNKNFNVPSYIEKSICYLQYMTYYDSIKKMSEMDANLLILPSKKRVGVFSGKIFDYLSAGRSILALVNPHDIAAKLIYETKSGYVADFDNIEEIKCAISSLYQDWKGNRVKQPGSEEISRQHRKYQVKKLSEWMSR